MKRRSFLTALATLLAWPLTRLMARENAVKADPKPRIDPDTWRVYLWDDITLVEEPDDSKWGHAILDSNPATIVVPTFPPPGSTYLALGRTVFEEEPYQRAGYPKARHFNYVSGPKWWGVRVRP